MVGGTGFYINAFLYDNDFSGEKKDLTIRKALNQILEDNGKEYLYDMLLKIDPKYAETIHLNNTKKVIRALEYNKETGEKFSDYNSKERLRKPAYKHNMFILNMERQNLYDRIDKRIDIMLDQGLIEEVNNLLDKYSPDLVSMQGLGYKEIVGYLKGKYSLDEAVFILKRNTRHFAKRQITWFKHQSDGIWINMDKFSTAEEAADYIFTIIKEKQND